MKLPIFSGDGRDTDYTAWKYQVKCLDRDAKVSTATLLQLIRQSVRGTASGLLISLGENVTLKQVLDKFDAIFGNVFSSRALKTRFLAMRQRPDKSVGSWACRVQTAIGQIMKVDPTEDEDDLQRTQFFFGLTNEKVQTGIRHLYDAGKTADYLLKKARSIEGEKPEEPEPSAAQVKSKVSRSTASVQQSTSVAQQPLNDVVSQQNISISAEEFKQLLTKVDQICSRLTAVEKVITSGGQSSQSKASKPPSRTVDNTSSSHHHTDSKKSTSTGKPRLFCERCRRNNHTIRQCVARFDVDGNPLNG